MSYAEVAYYGAFSDKNGILICAGTDALAIGKVENKLVRARGYGYIIGDGGRAFWISSKAIKKTVFSLEEGWGEETILKDEILKFSKVKNPADLIPFIYKKNPVLSLLWSNPLRFKKVV